MFYWANNGRISCKICSVLARVNLSVLKVVFVLNRTLIVQNFVHARVAVRVAMQIHTVVQQTVTRRQTCEFRCWYVLWWFTINLFLFIGVFRYGLSLAILPLQWILLAIQCFLGLFKLTLFVNIAMGWAFLASCEDIWSCIDLLNIKYATNTLDARRCLLMINRANFR